MLDTRQPGLRGQVTGGGYRRGRKAPPDGVTLLAADVTGEDPVRDVPARIAQDRSELRAVVNCAGIGPSARILGLVGMTIAAARDLAEFGIRIMTIAPGLVETPMLGPLTGELRTLAGAVIPFPRRLAQPAEFARLVLMVIEHDYLNVGSPASGDLPPSLTVDC